MPSIEHYQHNDQSTVQYQQKVEIIKVSVIDPVIPNRHYRKNIPCAPNHQIADKQQKVSIVFCAKTVVDPRTVMIHSENALVAHLAVRSAGRFDVVTTMAVSSPDSSEIVSSLVSVFHDRFDLRRDTLEPL